MAPIFRLGDDVLLQILSLLTHDELVSLRITCRYFCAVSHSRYLWNHLLQRDIVQQHEPLPCYMRPLVELGAVEIELMARRALGAATKAPVVTRFDRGLSVQWLRFVRGQWLLVAFSKNGQSILVMYSLISTQAGQPQVAAQATLPGQVSSGEVEVQEDQVVVALCFQDPQRMITVMSLRSSPTGFAFVELNRFDGVSHIRCLRQEFVGCGVRGTTASPLLLNWKTGAVQVLPPSPEGDGRYIAMAVRSDVCVVARSNTLSVYSLEDGVAQHVQDLKFDHTLGSVSVSAESASSPAGSRLQLFVTTHSGMHVYKVTQGDSGAFAADLVAQEVMKQSQIITSVPSLPRFGTSSSYLAWTNTPSSYFDRQAHIMVGRLEHSETSGTTQVKVISECKDYRLPSLHAMPVMDFDDGMGLIAIGNACGELALCNYAGPIPRRIADCLQPLPIPCQ